MDDPTYSSYDINKPPEAFKSIAGDVGINQNQINANGTPPSNFGQADFHFNIANDDNDKEEELDFDDDDNIPNQKPSGYSSNAQTNNNIINTNNINKNPQINKPPQQISQAQIYSERQPIKGNLNPQQYNQQSAQQYPPPQYSQQYPPGQNAQQYPQQYAPSQYPQQYPPNQYAGQYQSQYTSQYLQVNQNY